MKRKLTMALFMSSLGLALMHGQIIHIPDDYSSIQEGIDAAQEGDTVIVSEGVYFENLQIIGKTITLASQFLLDADTSHISRTIIDGSKTSNPDMGSTVFIQNVDGNSLLLAGLTLQGGTGFNYENSFQGGGIAMLHSSGTIRNNIIEKNSIDAAEGGSCGIGVGLGASDTLNFHNNIVRNNTSHSEGMSAGACLFRVAGKDAAFYIHDNLISHNSITSSGSYKVVGGGIYIESEYSYGADVQVYNNTITYNEIHCKSSHGGGMYVVFGNEKVSPVGPTQVRIYNNLIHNNYSQDVGGGIAIWNMAKYLQPGLEYPHDPILINNTITDNVAADGSGIFNYDASSVLINNILWNEASNEAGREIFQDSITEYDYCPSPCWPVEDNKGALHLYNNCIKGGWKSGMENEWEGTWHGTGNIDYDPLFHNESFQLTEQSYCAGNGTHSVEIEGLVYTIPEYDMYGNKRPHGIDDFPDMGAYESTYAKNPLPVHFNEISTQNNILQVYPNPFQDQITLRLSTDEVYQLKIFSPTGQVIHEGEFSGTEHQLDLTGIHNGFYIISIQSNEMSSTRKVIKR